MENNEDISSIRITTSGPAPPIFLPRQHQHHHPSSEDRNYAQFTAPIPNLNLRGSGPQRDDIQEETEDDGSISSPPTQFESLGNENQLESISMTIDTVPRDEQHNTGSHSYSNPKQVAILVGACLPIYFSALGVVIHDGHSHSPVVNIFMIISTISLIMAFLDLCVLFWMYERLGNSNSSHHNTYLRCYRFLKDFNIFLCVLVIIFGLLPLIIILIPHP